MANTRRYLSESVECSEKSSLPENNLTWSIIAAAVSSNLSASACCACLRRSHQCGWMPVRDNLDWIEWFTLYSGEFADSLASSSVRLTCMRRYRSL